jgi:hypothetical protein
MHGDRLCEGMYCRSVAISSGKAARDHCMSFLLNKYRRAACKRDAGSECKKGFPVAPETLVLLAARSSASA